MTVLFVVLWLILIFGMAALGAALGTWLANRKEK